MKFKKFLAVLLAFICAFASIPAYASESDSVIEPISITENTTIHAPEIEEIAETLEAGSMISNVIISGDTVTYTVYDNIEASITKKMKRALAFIQLQKVKKQMCS